MSLARSDACAASHVVDLDIFALPGGEADAQGAWRALANTGDALLWTPRNGGHWIATRGALIERIYRSPELFSNCEVGIPPGKFLIRMLPIQLDGAEHKAFRALIEPALRPAALHAYNDLARSLAGRTIDRLKPRGRCEFVLDFSMVMPLTVFLTIVSLPGEDGEMLHALTRRASRSPTQEQRGAAFGEIVAYLETWIEQRRRAPGDDLLSRIVHAEVDGVPLTHEQALGTALLLMFAGLDTVAAMMAFVMRYLAEHPLDRAWIVAHPTRVSYAAEELMRRHGVANNVRTATQDVALGDTVVRAGERIVVPSCLHGLDPAQFDHFDIVDFQRTLGQTGTFGWDPHRCAGANLARLEMRVLLEEWLTRIPDFSIDPAEPVRQQTGTSNGILQLPLRWYSDRSAPPKSRSKAGDRGRRGVMLETLFGLHGKTALVTGGGKVPQAIAELFCAVGATVVHEREPELSEPAVTELFARVADVEILVNGSVVTGPWPIDLLSMEEWDRVHSTNLRGAFLLMREAVRTMRRHGRGGRLISISTIGSTHPVLHGNYAYGSSRAGTNALSRQFAMDFAGEGILSNAILVGAIASDPFPEDCPMPPEGPGTRPERFPLGHGAPGDVAPIALMLASSAGRYINGQAIVVDGGFQIA